MELVLVLCIILIVVVMVILQWTNSTLAISSRAILSAFGAVIAGMSVLPAVPRGPEMNFQHDMSCKSCNIHAMHVMKDFSRDRHGKTHCVLP